MTDTNILTQLRIFSQEPVSRYMLCNTSEAWDVDPATQLTLTDLLDHLFFFSVVSQTVIYK
jgi:hypothetical protein